MMHANHAWDPVCIYLHHHPPAHWGHESGSALKLVYYPLWTEVQYKTHCIHRIGLIIINF